MIQQGQIKPVIDKVLPLEQARRRPAADPGPRGDRQGRGDAMNDVKKSDGANLTLEQDPGAGHPRAVHQWLGLKVIAVEDDGIELKATWREEWVVNLERRFTHGGILAALIDLGADWAMVRKLGRGVPTIDMRVDYHAVALPGDLTIKGKIVRMGGAVLDRRSARSSTRRASCSRAAAAPTSPRRLRRRKRDCRSMAQFKNLGDLIRRDRDLSKVAIIDLGGEETPCEYTYAELDAHGDGRRARADQARASSAATALRSCPPTAPNISPPISASCARASSRCR